MRQTYRFRHDASLRRRHALGAAVSLADVLEPALKSFPLGDHRRSPR
jgi:hypothetical protein